MRTVRRDGLTFRITQPHGLRIFVLGYASEPPQEAWLSIFSDNALSAGHNEIEILKYMTGL